MTSAPFVYFDRVVSASTIESDYIVQLDLGAAPAMTGSEQIVVAHLRCSRSAARDLRDRLNELLGGS